MSALWHTTKLWLLQRAAAPEGFTPNAEGTAELLKSLEWPVALVRQSNNYTVWMITDEGRTELQRLEAAGAPL